MKRIIAPLKLLSMLLCFSFLYACKGNSVKEAAAAAEGEPKLKTTTVVNNHEIIWGIDFLPNGDIIFTEKRGRIYRYSSGKTTEITGVPAGINTGGQGGLLDIKVHPAYSSNGWIYISFAADAREGGTTLNLVRFKLNGNAITNAETIFKTGGTNTWYGHYGSRIVFDNKGILYLGVGEGGATSYGGPNSTNMNAQNTKSDWGKIHRMTDDGKVPADNPVLPGNNAATTVYSYGHRNPQGLVFNTLTNQLWENEHGPMGGDELNLVQKGKNYGWPLVCYGKNYDGKEISANPTAPGIEAPVKYWVPSIATCALAVITGNQFKNWKGQLLTGSLKFNHISKCQVEGGKLVKEEKILQGIGRVRDIKQGPDGNLYVSVEGPGRIIRISAE